MRTLTLPLVSQNICLCGVCCTLATTALKSLLTTPDAGVGQVWGARPRSWLHLTQHIELWGQLHFSLNSNGHFMCFS